MIIELKNIEEIIRVFNTDIQANVISKTIEQIGFYGENRLAYRLRNDVYSRPASRRYKRTGNLLGGRKFINTSNTSLIESNPRLKGASKNYAKAVNKRTKYFDNLYTDVTDLTKKIMTTIIKKTF